MIVMSISAMCRWWVLDLPPAADETPMSPAAMSGAEVMSHQPAASSQLSRLQKRISLLRSVCVCLCICACVCVCACVRAWVYESFRPGKNVTTNGTALGCHFDTFSSRSNCPTIFIIPSMHRNLSVSLKSNHILRLSGTEHLKFHLLFGLGDLIAPSGHVTRSCLQGSTLF